MDLRNQKGGITPAEGCMFAAVGLFVLLLLAIIVIAFLRFQDRPRSSDAPPPAAMEIEVAPAPQIAEVRLATVERPS